MTATDRSPAVGVLALQGDYAAHARMLTGLRATAHEVRTPADLQGLDGLVLPGGESTTMTLGVAREGLSDPLRAFAASGRPVLGTCAGLIMLDRDHLGILDLTAERNAFGRQIRSFEADLELDGITAPGHPLRAAFIRAPWVSDHGPAVQPLGAVDGHVVAVRQGDVLAVSFHPEITGDDRVHAAFLARVRARLAG